MCFFLPNVESLSKKKNWSSLIHFPHNYFILTVCVYFPSVTVLKQLLLFYIFLSKYFTQNIWSFSTPYYTLLI